MATTLEINVTQTTLEIASDPPTVLEVTINPEAELIEVGIQGPPGVDGVGGIAEVAEDPSPELGGDLALGSYNINGTLENTGLVLDGGLL